MFLQVFRSQVTDPEAAHRALDRLIGTLDGSTDGWLGTTAGVTSDGRGITITRHHTAADGRRTAEGAAGRAWQDSMRELSSTPVTVQDCDEVMTQLRGDSTDAQFVQVVQGHIEDLERLEHALEMAGRWQSDVRSDVIGGLLALHGDGDFTQAVYFTSEADARQGERREAPAEIAMGGLVSNLTFFDLPRPWGYSP